MVPVVAQAIMGQRKEITLVNTSSRRKIRKLSERRTTETVKEEKQKKKVGSKREMAKSFTLPVGILRMGVE
tara:strand:+ start:617 stop:829 length:213 start_codon:yes stop_codon:yes gene_type:complete